MPKPLMLGCVPIFSRYAANGPIIGLALALYSVWMVRAGASKLNEADDLVYFGREPERNNKVCLTRAIWNGAATGTGVFKLMQEGSREIGGFHVVKVS